MQGIFDDTEYMCSYIYICNNEFINRGYTKQITKYFYLVLLAQPGCFFNLVSTAFILKTWKDKETDDINNR